MVERVDITLDVSQVGEIDDQYVPFPPFSSWPTLVPREDLWDSVNRDLREVADQAGADDLRAAREVALRTAAFDSGAIEGLYKTDRGLTFTVATQALAWEAQVQEDSSDALSLFEGQLEAFELVIDLVAERYPKISQAWIRRLHEVVTAAQDTYVVHTAVGPQEQPLPKGVYKHHPNHVKLADGGVHAYAPVAMTQSEMQRLLDEIDTTEFQEAHPVLQASYAHYAFVVIHPFADGNGRVARALASVFTYRAASVPLLVLAHQRDEYFSSLGEADGGAPGAFIGFVGRSCRDAIEMVAESLRTAHAAKPEDVLSAFRRLYIAQGDLSHRQLDELANEAAARLVEMLNAQISQLSVPDGVEIEAIPGTGGGQRPIPEGFRSVVTPGPRSVHIGLHASPPANAVLNDVLQIFVSKDSDPATSLMIRATGSSDEIVFGQLDLLPDVSSSALLRLENFVRRILGEDLQSLLELARAELRQQGY
jgi:Fic family protein